MATLLGTPAKLLVNTNGEGKRLKWLNCWKTNDHCVNTTADFTVDADHVLSFMTTAYPFPNGYFQQENASCDTAYIISNWLQVYYTPNGLHSE